MIGLFFSIDIFFNIFITLFISHVAIFLKQIFYLKAIERTGAFRHPKVLLPLSKHQELLSKLNKYTEKNIFPITRVRDQHMFAIKEAY